MCHQKRALSRPLHAFSFRLAGLGLLFMATASGLAAQPVETSHPVADFLRRLEEKGILEIGFLSTLPRDEKEIADALARAAEKTGMLGPWDRRQLERYRDAFDPERKRRSRLHRRDGSFELHGSAEYYTNITARDSLPSRQIYAFGSFTPGVEATYRDWAYVTSSATVAMDRSYHPRFKAHYDPQRGLPYNVNRDGVDVFSGTVSTFDGFRVVAGVGGPEIRLEVGQDWNAWGPGHWQHATLGTRPHFWVSDILPASPGTGFHGTQSPGSERRGYRYPGEGPPMPQARLRLGSDHWEYVKIVGQRKGLWNDSGSASLIAHRLQFRYGSWKFGATEMLAIGSRGPDAVLLVPGVPLRFAEHLAGDQDNASMSVDAEWIWKGRGRFYGEFFLDDYSGPPLNFWGNKFAWMLGGTLHDVLGLQNQIRLEYSHVDPWVYGHHEVGTQMQSYGALLGSALPPNSHALFVSAAFPLPYGVTGEGLWRFSQRDFTSGGSSIFDVHDPDIHGYRKKFLTANVETRQELGLSLGWNPKHFVALNGGAGWLFVDGWKGDASRSPVSWPLVSGTVTLRY